jgi:hypothetical protein
MEETRSLYEQIVHNRFDAIHWIADMEAPGPVPDPREGSLRSMAQLALQRLHHLQAVIDETSDELRRLENMIDESISGLGET